MKLKFLKKLFKPRLEVVSLCPEIQIDDETKKILEADIKRIFPNPIGHGMTKRRHSFGKITSLPITRKHRDNENLAWLLDDKE